MEGIRYYENLIDEVRDLTSVALVKKQDVAKLNYPILIEKIKVAAKEGESICYIGITQMNEFDKKLLEKDGFTVTIVDIETNNSYDTSKSLAQYIPNLPKKQWKIKW